MDRKTALFALLAAIFFPAGAAADTSVECVGGYVDPEASRACSASINPDTQDWRFKACAAARMFALLTDGCRVELGEKEKAKFFKTAVGWREAGGREWRLMDQASAAGETYPDAEARCARAGYALPELADLRFLRKFGYGYLDVLFSGLVWINNGPGAGKFVGSQEVFRYDAGNDAAEKWTFNDAAARTLCVYKAP